MVECQLPKLNTRVRFPSLAFRDEGNMYVTNKGYDNWQSF